MPAVTEPPASTTAAKPQISVAPPKSPKKKNNNNNNNNDSTPAARPSDTTKTDSATTPAPGEASDPPTPAQPTTTVTASRQPAQARLAPAPIDSQLAANQSPQTTTDTVTDVSAFSAPQPATATPGLADVTSSVLTAMLAPFALPGPSAPPDSPVLLAALAWARRETQREIGDTTPEVAAQQTALALDTVNAPLAVTAAAAMQPTGKKPPANTAPVAAADSYTTTTGTTLTIAGPGVLANDLFCV